MIGPFSDDGGKVSLGHIELNAVDSEKRVDCHQGCALVAVDKWVVLSNPECIGCSDFGKISLFICPLVLRARQSRFEHWTVANTRGATMLRKLFVVDGHDKLEPEPFRFIHVR
jgi:hypothetical protein